MDIKERTKWIIYDVIKREKLSVDMLAVRLKCSVSLINNYKKTRNIPNAEFVANLFKEFDVNPNWILAGEGPKYLDKDSHAGSATNVIPIDPDMGMAMEIVVEVEQEEGVEIPSPQREAVIRILYEEIIRSKSDSKAKYRDLVASFKEEND